MTDKELADKCVASGVGGQGKHPLSSDGVGFYQTPGDESDGLCAKLFVRDWRVAGACLQRWPTTINVEHLEMTLDEMLRDPRAIIEAFVEAWIGDD